MSEISGEEKAEVRKSTQIPADLGRFKGWADRECGAWPSGLQLKAWDAAHGRITIDDFVDALRLCRG